jgi:endoribonuclease Dicer
MVNTVALVNQQASYIRRHTHYSVGAYSGDLNVDLWPEEKWMEELSKNQVQCKDKVMYPNWLSGLWCAVCVLFFFMQIMVMTCQIFLNLVLHGYVQLPDVNLIIFDECHHAVNDQPMRQIMQQFEHCPRELQPRILGLTATLLNSNCKASRVEEEVHSLEKTFLSTVATCENLLLVRRYGRVTSQSDLTFHYFIKKYVQ